jgi:hypothetical protein
MWGILGHRRLVPDPISKADSGSLRAGPLPPLPNGSIREKVGWIVAGTDTRVVVFTGHRGVD